MTTPKYISAFFNAYLSAALWTTPSEHEGCDCDALDECFGIEDISSGTMRVMYEDCVDFILANRDDLKGLEPAQAGHDFWLTRNGHGAGYWDRGLGESGDRLTAVSKVYGGVDLYVGDDGLIYA